ncbi:MAG: hypothetical protein CMN59_00910 [Sphingobium sp.]|nr:hypothetical protein [Sphingobium sp.]MBS47431.1 hypothetical protein [Sphingobium sp.]
MLRRFIAAAALAASVAVIAPSAALAQDRGHGGWQSQRGYGDSHGVRQVHRGERGSHGFNRGHGYQSYRSHGYSNSGEHARRGGRAYDHGRGYAVNHRSH